MMSISPCRCPKHLGNAKAASAPFSFSSVQSHKKSSTVFYCGRMSAFSLEPCNVVSGVRFDGWVLHSDRSS